MFDGFSSSQEVEAKDRSELDPEIDSTPWANTLDSHGQGNIERIEREMPRHRIDELWPPQSPHNMQIVGNEPLLKLGHKLLEMSHTHKVRTQESRGLEFSSGRAVRWEGPRFDS